MWRFTHFSIRNYTMSDLTPLFRQCVDIVSKELGASALNKPHKPPAYLVSDTFAKECDLMYGNLVQMAKFVGEVRPLYLQVNDEFSRFDKGVSRGLSVEDKNKIDEDFKVKVQQLYEKLKFLQSYERKRNQLVESKRKGKGFISGIFGPEESPQEVYNLTLASHRTQILRFLSDTTKAVNTSFERMQQKRHSREKQLNLLHFQNLNDEELEAVDAYRQDYQFDVVQDEEQSAVNLEQELTQQQIQELKLENKELLTMKTNQFKQVEKLHNSMVDIVKLQTELTMHLETQAEQIYNLLDNQDQVEVDLRMGNRNLSKATNRNKRGSNMIITTCFVLGFLILFVDYIS